MSGHLRAQPPPASTLPRCSSSRWPHAGRWPTIWPVKGWMTAKASGGSRILTSPVSQSRNEAFIESQHRPRWGGIDGEASKASFWICSETKWEATISPMVQHGPCSSSKTSPTTGSNRQGPPPRCSTQAGRKALLWCRPLGEKFRVSLGVVHPGRLAAGPMRSPGVGRQPYFLLPWRIRAPRLAPDLGAGDQLWFPQGGCRGARPLQDRFPQIPRILPNHWGQTGWSWSLRPEDEAVRTW